MARATLMPGYKYSGGSYICVNCAHDDGNRELLKTFGDERDPVFHGEFSDIKSPKCAICKAKMIDVVSNSYARSGGVDDDDAPAKKNPTKKAEAPAPAKKSTKKSVPKTDAPKRRGRPPKAKVEATDKAVKRRGRPPKIRAELPFNNSSLSEPPTLDGVVKRGRGRPKGSKNKPKVA